MGTNNILREALCTRVLSCKVGSVMTNHSHECIFYKQYFASAFLKNNCTVCLLMTISSMMPLKFMMRFLTLRFSAGGLFFWAKLTNFAGASLCFSVCYFSSAPPSARSRSLVTTKEDSRRLIYSLADDHVVPLLASVCSRCSSALGK